MSERFSLPCAVSLLLIRDNKILLLRRYNTGWQDGCYGVPAGHIEGGESMISALVREAKEEIGIELAPATMHFAHLTHTMTNKEYAYVYFAATMWSGELKNAEPEKCDKLLWSPLDKLPTNTIPSIREAIEAYVSGSYYSEHGWHK